MGSAAAFIVSPLLIAYAITLVLGLLSLKSPLDQIGDPYFTLLEVLIIVLAPVLVLVMVAVHGYASPGTKFFSLSALAFMIILAGITSSVHFVVLTVSRQIAAAGFPWASMFFSFEWPSVAYTLDIFAWDVFFALSMLFAAVVFRNGRLETAIRYLMILGGVLSLAGLIGVALADMNIRNIGIVGYVGVSLVIFPLLGVLFWRTGSVPEGSG
jgi:hypothetical protein